MTQQTLFPQPTGTDLQVLNWIQVGTSDEPVALYAIRDVTGLSERSIKGAVENLRKTYGIAVGAGDHSQAGTSSRRHQRRSRRQ